MSNVHFVARLRNADVCLIRRASATSAAAELLACPNLRFGQLNLQKSAATSFGTHPAHAALPIPTHNRA